MIGAQGQGKEDGRVHGDKNFMQALVDTKGLIAVFSGHDHRNDWHVFLLSSDFLKLQLIALGA